MLRLQDNVALVLGLGQATPEGWGIGSTLAVVLAREGAKIVGGNRSLSSAQITKSRVESEGGCCDVFEVEATKPESVKSLVDACMSKYGRIDILVNNVGRSEPGDPASMDVGTWSSQLDVNLTSAYLACHYVLPIMEKQKHGSVISVASIAGLRYIGKPQVAYSAAKAALIQLSKTTAVIYAAKGVRLNTVVPGLMLTPYTEKLADRYATGDEKDEYMQMRHNQVPMGRMGDAWDVAYAVLFLGSDESKYITGQEIVVDGGITASTGRP